MTPLIGRDQEMGSLFDRWNQTREGLGQAVMLVGDAGLGKSRLVHVLRKHVSVDDDPPDRGVAMLALPLELGALPGHRLLDERILGFVPGEAPKEQLERLKEYLRGFDIDLADERAAHRLLMEPAGRRRVSGGPVHAAAPEGTDLELISHAGWQRRRAKPRCCFVVEDLHWIDPTTLDLLRSLVDDPLAEPIMCVFTFRPGVRGQRGPAGA